MTTKWLLGATTALALMATPALAANDAAPSGDAAKGTNNAQQAIDKALNDRDAADPSSDAAADKTADSGRPKGERAMAQRRLRQALKEAGFTDVRILGATYRIRARDEDGNTIFLRINPRAMDRHAMNKDDMSRHGMNRDMNRGMAGDDDMASDDVASDDVDQARMAERGLKDGGMNRDAMGGETTGAGEGGQAYGAGPMEPRGAGGGFGNRDHRRGGGDAFAYDRAYDQGFRDGYNRGFDRSHGWR
ncbi:MAG: hypothetical protein KIT48_02380 [Pseudolabrys sp.]|nr:hypothetical protein [Pseudolabrys sp.]